MSSTASNDLSTEIDNRYSTLFAHEYCWAKLSDNALVSAIKQYYQDGENPLWLLRNSVKTAQDLRIYLEWIITVEKRKLAITDEVYIRARDPEFRKYFFEATSPGNTIKGVTGHDEGEKCPQHEPYSSVITTEIPPGVELDPTIERLNIEPIIELVEIESLGGKNDRGNEPYRLCSSRKFQTVSISIHR